MNCNVRRKSSLAMKLLVGSALSSLAIAGARAQGNGTNLETVVVTGTSIRGAAPVGSDLATVTRSQIEDTMQPTVQSLFSDIPELGNFGTAGVGNQNNDRAGGFSPTIHNVGAGSSIATLTLINGHRFPTTGLTESNTDPTIVASSAVERVEILPDGASAIYGADAVVGVVNVITRHNYRGLEMNTQAGIADHYHTFNGSIVTGTSWDGGSLMLAYDYSSKSNLMYGFRDFETPRQDIRRGAVDPSLFEGIATSLPSNTMTTTPAAGVGTTGPYGVAIPYPSDGVNAQGFNCPVASIAASSGANAFYYQPDGTYNGSSFRTSSSSNPSQGACDSNKYSSVIASETRNNLFIEASREIADNLALDMTFSFASRTNNSPTSRGTVSATAFGSGSPNTTQINPFYVGNATTGTNSEFIRYDFNALLGPGAFDKLYMNNSFLTADLTWDLGSGRELTFGGVAGLNFNQQHDAGQVSSGEALMALNGTTNTTGTPTANAIPDPYGLNGIYTATRVLTTPNALDVWNPPATNKTSAAVIRSLKDGGFDQTANQTIQDLKAKFDGPVFDMPAGSVKAAVGLEFLHQTMEEGGTNITSAGAAISTSQAFFYRTGRSVYSAYAEIDMPLINEDMGVPLVQRFDIDISGRYDHYSDFGDTKNPKVGLDWFVIDGLKARASFGTSFVAPGLHDALGTNNQSIIRGAGTPTNNVIPFGVANTYNGGAGTANTWVATPSTCAAGGGTVVNSSLKSVAAPFTGAYACQVRFGATQGATTSAAFQIAGGHLGLKPAVGRSYTAGLDIDGSKFGLDGLTVSATYWQTAYLGLITGGGATHPSLTNFAPPGGWTATSPFMQDFMANRVLGIAVPPVIWATVDNRLNNSFDVWMNGIDYSVNYVLRTDDLGTFRFGASGTETLRYSQRPHIIGGVVEGGILDGKDGKNQPRYGNAANEMQARLTSGWQYGAFGLGLGMNYIHPSVGRSTAFPYSLPGPGRGQIDPATGQWESAGFIHVGALLVFDLNVNYQLPKGFLGLPDAVGGTQFSLKIQNLFDRDPPANPTSANGISGGNPVGRMFTIGLRKRL